MVEIISSRPCKLFVMTSPGPCFNGCNGCIGCNARVVVLVSWLLFYVNGCGVWWVNVSGWFSFFVMD